MNRVRHFESNGDCLLEQISCGEILSYFFHPSKRENSLFKRNGVLIDLGIIFVTVGGRVILIKGKRRRDFGLTLA